MSRVDFAETNQKARDVLGCDLHAMQQTIAMVEDTGEFSETDAEP